MIPPVFVIHCNELPERSITARVHMRARRCEAAFWAAPHGVSWGLATTKEFEPDQRISPGHVSLNLAHWNLWQHIYLRGDTEAIVFEDDVVLPEDWAEQIESLFKNLRRYNPGWQLVFLGLAEQTGPKVWNKVTERVGGPESPLARMGWPWGTHALLIRRSALPILLRHCAIAERNMDQQLYKRVLEPGHLNWCATIPSIIHQRTCDYKGVGAPEWTPSTIDPAHIPAIRQTAPPNAPPELMAATLAMIDPYPCIYRGEAMDDHGRASKGKVVPVSECARLNRPCHSRAVETVGDVTTEHGDAVACEVCVHRQGMTVPDKPRRRLPLPEGHFNPSIIMWRNRLVLATRDSWGHSKVSLWYLDNENADWSGEWRVTQIGSYSSGHPLAPRLEDPRLFVAPCSVSRRAKLHCMFSLPDGYPPKIVQVGYARFDEELTGIESVTVFKSPNNNAYEKNWIPIVDDGKIGWVYSMKPEHIVITSTGEQLTEYIATPNLLPWTGGAMRGGAVPVRVGGELYHFFHGCLKRAQGSVYSVGCYVSEAKPPYRILRQTKSPLIWPDLPAAGEEVVKRYVVWPGGVVFHQGQFFIALGVDDCHCRIDSLTFEEVEAAMTDVPEYDNSIGVRDTAVCRGTKRDEME